MYKIIFSIKLVDRNKGQYSAQKCHDTHANWNKVEHDKIEIIWYRHYKTDENTNFRQAVSKLLANMHSKFIQLRLEWLCLSEGNSETSW